MKPTDDARARDGRRLPRRGERDPRVPRRGNAVAPAEPFELAQVVRCAHSTSRRAVIPTMWRPDRFRLLAGRLKPDDPCGASRRKSARTRGPAASGRPPRRERLPRRRPLHDRPTSPCTRTADRADEAASTSSPTRDLSAWFERIEAQPGYMEDVEPYGANAAPAGPVRPERRRACPGSDGTGARLDPRTGRRHRRKCAALSTAASAGGRRGARRARMRAWRR